MRLSLALLFLLLASSLLTSCNPLYVARAAVEETKILMSREAIVDVADDPEVSQTDREKLKLVLRAREFAQQKLNLEPRDSFTMYADIGREQLAWVLVASKKDAFELYNWWFPFVGTVPYKGFFDREDADSAAHDLEDEGFETRVRPTDAISTLGWFNDPLLSTTLKNQPAQIANTVIHESLHSTVWIPGHVDFNESLANFVGVIGAQRFAQYLVEQCPSDKPECTKQAKYFLDQTEQRIRFEFELADFVTSTYARLDQIYKANLSPEQKLSEREKIFNECVAPLRTKYPAMQAFKSVNNAEIIQFKLYLTGLREFDQLYQKLDKDMPSFLDAMHKIAEQTGNDQNSLPFELLQKAISQ